MLHTAYEGLKSLIHICVNIFTCLCVIRVYTCVYPCQHVCVSVSVWMYVSAFLCICVDVCMHGIFFYILCAHITFVCVVCAHLCVRVCICLSLLYKHGISAESMTVQEHAKSCSCLQKRCRASERHLWRTTMQFRNSVRYATRNRVWQDFIYKLVVTALSEVHAVGFGFGYSNLSG